MSEQILTAFNIKEPEGDGDKNLPFPDTFAADFRDLIEVDSADSVSQEIEAVADGLAQEAATRLAADAAFALANSGTNSGDQKGDASTVTQGIGGAFSAVVPLPAASGSIVLNQAGEYEQAPGFSGVVENWQDLDPLDPSSLITVGMIPALLTRLGITIPTP